MLTGRALKEETQKSLKELQGKKSSEGNEPNHPGFKNGSRNKKITKTSLELENLGKNSRIIDARIKNRIKQIEERTSCAKDITENIDTTVK